MADNIKRILVTGGAGFIGSHLCEALLKQGHHVICVDNFCSGSRENISHLTSHPHFEVVCHDICFPLFSEVDQIYNLASPAPQEGHADPILTIKTNTQGPLNMLGLSKRLNIKVLQASSGTIYGDMQSSAQKEEQWGNANPIGSHACYRETKRCAETLFFDYYRKHSCKIKIARIFPTFGPRMKCGITAYILQALQDETLNFHEKRHQPISLCYVDDVVEGLIALMNSDDQIRGPINIGRPQEWTLGELADKILEITESKSSAQFQVPTAKKELFSIPDVSLASKQLHWKPKTSLDVGLEKTIAHLKTTLNYSPRFV